MIALLLAAALHAPVHDRMTLPRPAATAAYSIDPSIAEASVEAGTVNVLCRSPGSTTIAIVAPDGVETIELVVDQPPPGSFLARMVEPQEGAAWEGIYDSGAGRLTNALDVFSRTPHGFTRLRAVDVTRVGETASGDARTSLPFLSAAIARGGMQLTLFDELVQQSPLTLEGTSLRGAHFEGAGLALHAGWTSPLLYQGVLLPSQSETAAGASYTVGRFTPSLYWFPSDSPFGGTRGAMGSLMYEQGRLEDRFHLRAEAGWGGKPGAALDLSYRGVTDRLILSARHQPYGFASVGVGRPHGSFLDAAFSDRTLPRLTADLSTSLARQELPAVVQQSASATGELRYLLGSGFSAIAGSTVAGFHSGAARVRSVTVPVGFAWESERTGVTALYRWERNSASNQGGSGARLSLRHGMRQLYATAFADWQQDAATVDLVFRDDPQLAQAFAQLGLDARTPEDLARILHDNPELAQLGYIEGATVNLHPWRVQAGGDLSWLPAPGQQLRLHLQVDRRRSVAHLDQLALSTLSYTGRLSDKAEALAAASIWTRDIGGGATTGWSVLVGLRLRFDGLPSLGGGRVRGSVVDADLRGIAGVRVRMDGAREAVTDAQGEVEFSGAGDGSHRLVALLPEGAYFTTRSSIEVFGGERGQFGLAFSPARVAGYVRDDSGNPIAGAELRLAGEMTTTDSSGHYAFALAEGAATLAVQGDSLPPGYDTGWLHPVDLRLTSALPRQVDFEIPAERSIAGVVAAASRQQIAVWIKGGHAKAVADEQGRFLFRHLKPGLVVIEADVDGRVLSRSVQVPSAPAAIRDVVLSDRPSPFASN